MKVIVDEARFYYILGNCSQELFSYHKLDWFSDELSRSVIFFRKALYVIRQINFPTDEELFLQSCIETNLGNNLSSQGRAFCCIPLWDSAFKCKQNPVSIISKANHGLFLASNVYDLSHKHYHYFTAYKLISLGLEHLDGLYPEQRVAYSEDSNFMNFKVWFEDNFKPEDFDYFESFEEEVETRKQGDAAGESSIQDHETLDNDEVKTMIGTAAVLASRSPTASITLSGMGASLSYSESGNPDDFVGTTVSIITEVGKHFVAPFKPVFESIENLNTVNSTGELFNSNKQCK